MAQRLPGQESTPGKLNPPLVTVSGRIDEKAKSSGLDERVIATETKLRLHRSGIVGKEGGHATVDPVRIRANVIAWHDAGFGECATENLEREVRGRVADLVDSFINDYLSSKKGS
jgi:hypothetical protein